MLGFDQRPDIRAAQVRLLYDQLQPALYATIVNAVIVFAVFWHEVARPFLILWALAILFVVAVRYSFRRAYFRKPPADAETLGWGYRYLYGVAANASLWGIAGFLFFTTHSYIHQIFLAFVLMGMVSGSISTLSSLRGAHILFILLSVLPYAARLVSVGGGLHLAMTGMLAVYVVMMGMIGNRLCDTISESLRLRFKNTDLLEDLTRAKNELQKAYGEMEQQVAERTADLTKSEEALRDADRRKNEFLAMLGHELRNPLAPIRNALQVLRNPDVPDATLKWARDVMDRQIDHLTRLVDDLLDVSRIVYGKITLQEKLLEIGTAVNHAVDACLPLMEARHQELVVHIPGESFWVKGDVVRLEQIISNLLNNASKYSEPGKRILVDVGATELWVTVRVRDYGIGISPEVMPYVFDLFAQADHTLARTQGGLGIGLTLVRHLVKMHGGRVEVHSEGPGRGSEFLVHLPRRPAPAHLEARPAPRRPIESKKALRVLVVDDNEDAVETLALLLQLEGYTVGTALDGPAALAEAEQFHPEVVLLDIGMPGMDGYEVVREFRKRDETKSIPIVALTGYGQPEDRARAKTAGFSDHLTKPISPESLNAMLKSYRSA
jgi:signal transduction histidine kinase